MDKSRQTNPGRLCEKNGNWEGIAPRSSKLGIDITYLEFSHSLQEVGIEEDKNEKKR